MKTITKEEFKKLSSIEDVACISFYFPTHRGGLEVINREDQRVFKNQLKEVREKLRKRKLETDQIEHLLQPAQDLLNDPEFWRHQTEAVAIFLANNFLQNFHLPFPVEASYHISSEFYLRPLMPVFSGNGQFYLLTLNLHHVALYKGNREQLEEIYVEDITPQRLEEVVGYDYKEAFLQFRAHHDSHRQGSFHGHGEWKGEFKKQEIVHFFREIDKSIAPILEGSNAPLIVSSLDYLWPIYQNANTYPHLSEERISGNPKDFTIEELHRKTWNQIYILFDEERQNKVAQYEQFQNTERTSFDINEIVPAAFAGRVDTLFLQNEGDIWGIFDPKNEKLNIQEQQTLNNTSLLNMLAKEVFLHGGEVYLQRKETLPQPFSEVNALFRY